MPHIYMNDQQTQVAHGELLTKRTDSLSFLNSRAVWTGSDGGSNTVSPRATGKRNIKYEKTTSTIESVINGPVSAVQNNSKVNLAL